MRRSRQTRETARALVSPFFAWTNAVLKGGEMLLDSMQAAARRTRVGIVPTADAPPAKPRAKRRKGRARRR